MTVRITGSSTASISVKFFLCLLPHAAAEAGFVPLFDGGQTPMAEREYANFVLRLEYKLEADPNNGIGIRAPRNGQTSVHGMEIQILDRTGPKYAPMKLRPEQYHAGADRVPEETGRME